MLKTLWGWIKQLVWIELDKGPVPTPAEKEEIPQYKTPEVWPFPGPRPTNTAIHNLYTGMETSGEHIYYRNSSGHVTGGLKGGDDDGNMVWNVRMVVWWLSEKKTKPGRNILKVGDWCHSSRCIRPGHLKAVYEPLEDPSEGVELPVSVSAGPPVYKPRTVKRRVSKMHKYNDRTKCVSAKVWFPTREVAMAAAKEYNRDIRKPGQVHLYGYDCDWCDGGHLTKHDPAKRKKYKHAGSW